MCLTDDPLSTVISKRLEHLLFDDRKTKFEVVYNVKKWREASVSSHRVQSPNFFKAVSFHVSLYVKFGNIRCCDFSINNP